jgi:hypothetical protein
MLWAADSPSIVLPALRETLRQEAQSTSHGSAANDAAT